MERAPARGSFVPTTIRMPIGKRKLIGARSVLQRACRRLLQDIARRLRHPSQPLLFAIRTPRRCYLDGRRITAPVK
jgi:hypothetical protein